MLRASKVAVIGVFVVESQKPLWWLFWSICKRVLGREWSWCGCSCL